MSETIKLIYDLQLRTVNALTDLHLFKIIISKDEPYTQGYADGMIFASDTILKYLNEYMRSYASNDC